MRLWPFGQKVEKRDVQFSPAFSVMLANMSRGNIAAAGLNVTPDSALRMMAVWACVRVISEDVASLPLPLYRRLSRGKERATSHPLYSVLHDAPNPEMTSMAFRETMTSHVLLYGTAYANIVSIAGRVAQLWPIHPSRVSLRRNPRTDELEYYVQPVVGEEARIPLNRMFRLPGLSMNGIVGLSPIAIARESIGLGLASEQFAAGFFANGARPSIVLEHPGSLSEEAHSRVRADFEGTHVGLSNAQRVALLEEGMKLHEYSLPQKDAQFLEQRKFSVEEVARLYRVHPHKIGVMEGTQTYASVEQANIDHVVSTIRPWAVRWEQAIQQQLVPAEERAEFFAEFLIDGLLRGDATARGNFYRTLWNIGALSANDIRELENLNPVEGGDQYFVPLNTVPAEAAASSSEAEPTVPVAPRSAHPELPPVLLNGGNGHVR
jgi:HK97 family phage portal protein